MLKEREIISEIERYLQISFEMIRGFVMGLRLAVLTKYQSLLV